MGQKAGGGEKALLTHQPATLGPGFLGLEQLISPLEHSEKEAASVSHGKFWTGRRTIQAPVLLCDLGQSLHSLVPSPLQNQRAHYSQGWAPTPPPPASLLPSQDLRPGGSFSRKPHISISVVKNQRKHPHPVLLP